mmetsp:Transcript_369/g.871  ORF Transcript_369/g.871 Transcript_369/m.871 type:complete len:277 (-) Transcript_369:32-862(-)
MLHLRFNEEPPFSFQKGRPRRRCHVQVQGAHGGDAQGEHGCDGVRGIRPLRPQQRPGGWLEGPASTRELGPRSGRRDAKRKLGWGHPAPQRPSPRAPDPIVAAHARAPQAALDQPPWIWAAQQLAAAHGGASALRKHPPLEQERAACRGPSRLCTDTLSACRGTPFGRARIGSSKGLQFHGDKGLKGLARHCPRPAERRSRRSPRRRRQRGTPSARGAERGRRQGAKSGRRQGCAAVRGGGCRGGVEGGASEGRPHAAALEGAPGTATKRTPPLSA